MTKLLRANHKNHLGSPGLAGWAIVDLPVSFFGLFSKGNITQLPAPLVLNGQYNPTIQPSLSEEEWRKLICAAFQVSSAPPAGAAYLTMCKLIHNWAAPF